MRRKRQCIQMQGQRLAVEISTAQNLIQCRENKRVIGYRIHLIFEDTTSGLQGIP